jgi:tetratricopeptide (TPR) repeat protein
MQQYREARLADRADEARRLLQEADGLSRATGDDRDLVDVLKGLAQFERDTGAPARALPIYEEAVTIARRLDDALLLAHTVRHLGDSLMELGDAAAAGPCFDEALSLYRAHPEGADLDLANALRPAAVHAELVGDAPAALRLWREARDLYERAAVDAGVMECARRIERLSQSAG